MQHKIVSGIAEIITMYFNRRIPRAASALAYSTIFTLFPFLICLSAMFGSLNISEVQIIETLSGVMPEGAVEIISAYFAYISETSAVTPMFYTGLAVTLTSSAAAFRGLLMTMHDIYGTQHKPGIVGVIISFLMSIVFLLIIYASCIIIFCGKWIMQRIETYFDIILFVDIWKWLRFVLLFVVMFLMLYALYVVTTPRGERRYPKGRGALISSLMLGGVSIIYSRVISFSSRYTLLYGSLASIVVLMLWLYTAGCIIFLGNIINVVIYNRTGKDKKLVNK